MTISSNPLKAESALVANERRLTLVGLQALLIGRTLEDRQTVLHQNRVSKQAFSAQELAVFATRARYGAALNRLERQRLSTGMRIASKPAFLSLAKAIGDHLRKLQIVGSDDPGTPIDTSFDPGEGTTTDNGVDSTIDSSLQFDQYPQNVQESAQSLFDSNAQPQLNDQQQQISGQIRSFVGAGGISGGAPHAPGSGYAGGFIDDNGDLNIGKVNEVLTGVVVGAALGVGGVVGAALGALALIVVPRVLAAFEDEIGDLLVGTLPGQ